MLGIAYNSGEKFVVYKRHRGRVYYDFVKYSPLQPSQLSVSSNCIERGNPSPKSIEYPPLICIERLLLTVTHLFTLRDYS